MKRPSALVALVGTVGWTEACRPVWRCTVLPADEPLVGRDLGGDVGGRVHVHVDELAAAAALALRAARSSSAITAKCAPVW